MCHAIGRDANSDSTAQHACSSHRLPSWDCEFGPALQNNAVTSRIIIIIIDIIITDINATYDTVIAPRKLLAQSDLRSWHSDRSIGAPYIATMIRSNNQAAWAQRATAGSSATAASLPAFVPAGKPAIAAAPATWSAAWSAAWPHTATGGRKLHRAARTVARKRKVAARVECGTSDGNPGVKKAPRKNMHGRHATHCPQYTATRPFLTCSGCV